MQPTPQQLAWQRAEFGIFCHFGINTFFGKEWSDGTLPASGFNPNVLDATQWARTIKQAGAHYAILTAKHHDGFCLWPTSTTDYSVACSPWRDGHGDVVREFVDACRAEGIKPGLYLSPWDRNHPSYQDAAAYDAVYCQQLTELCCNYGELFELWFDGAGSEGRVYDWHRIMAVAEAHQPNAAIFNMGKPSIRWIGNEDGLAADPVSYHVTDIHASAFHANDPGTVLDGKVYLPPECDVAIRRNWFWQEDDLDTLKSVDHLLAIAYRSIGLGCNLLLNVPPDRNGLISTEDRERLLSFSAEWQRRFATPVEASLHAQGATWTARFADTQTIDHLRLEEDLTTGQKVSAFTISDAAGRVLATGSSIGSQRIVAFAPSTTTRVSIHVAGDGAVLTRVAGYHAGVSTIPEPNDRLDYKAWADKADKA
ncbi:MAG: alpha-L-fucosidase [Planctomycetota bacterium]|jgi:alpha-L-fucosidase|nr:alpha-L-fucosidase [Planctomycetota bacterium]